MLTITRGNVSILVPEEWLFNDGRIKKYAVEKVDRMFKKAEAFNSMSKGDVV
nr:MAG TPA: major outer membrane lipoprotein [Caudoviricetes sp.]